MPFHLVSHAFGYRNQQVIADVVTKGIVDCFEAVEIHKHQRKLRALAVGLVDRLLETILQQDAVRQSRQVIVQRQLASSRLASASERARIEVRACIRASSIETSSVMPRIASVTTVTSIASQSLFTP